MIAELVARGRERAQALGVRGARRVIGQRRGGRNSGVESAATRRTINSSCLSRRASAKATRHSHSMRIRLVQTGVRLERRLLKVMKGVAELHDISLGDLIEGVMLHAFEGKAPTFFSDPKFLLVGALYFGKKLLGKDPTAA